MRQRCFSRGPRHLSLERQKKEAETATGVAFRLLSDEHLILKGSLRLYEFLIEIMAGLIFAD